MIDPKTGFLTEVEQVDDNLPVTVRGVKKRLWSQTNKQEWLNIYQKYMQERLKLQPKPMGIPPDLGKDVTIGRHGIRSIGRTGRLSKLSLQKTRTEKLDLGRLKRPTTVRDLKQDCLQRKATRCRTSGRGRQNQRQRTVVEAMQQDLEEASTANEDTLSSIDDRSLHDPSEHEWRDSMQRIDNKIYLELCDSDEETDEMDFVQQGSQRGVDQAAECNTNVSTDDDGYVECTINAVEADGDCSNNSINKRNFTRLKQNTLKLIKHSNMCLFKLNKQYVECYCCLKRFTDMQSLRSHTKNSHNYEEITGTICKDSFLNVDITGLKCTTCSTTMDSLNELEQHLKSHDVRLKDYESLLIPYKMCSDTFTCQICQEQFPNRQSLQKHTIGHFTNFECGECLKNFTSMRSLKYHLYREHDRDHEEACDSTLDSVDCEMEGSGSESEARFKCGHCPKKFRYDYKRFQHLVKEHSGETKLFQCEFCPKIFMTVHWLTKHMNCVHRQELY